MWKMSNGTWQFLSSWCFSALSLSATPCFWSVRLDVKQMDFQAFEILSCPFPCFLHHFHSWLFWKPFSHPQQVLLFSTVCFSAKEQLQCPCGSQDPWQTKFTQDQKNQSNIWHRFMCFYPIVTPPPNTSPVPQGLDLYLFEKLSSWKKCCWIPTIKMWNQWVRSVYLGNVSMWNQ